MEQKIQWQRLIGPVVGLKRSLLQVFVLAAILQVVVLVIPVFTQWIVDDAITSGDQGLLLALVLGLVLTLLTRVAMEFACEWLGISLSFQFGTQWARREMAHLVRLPMRWFEQRHVGDVVSRFHSLHAIQQTITGSLVGMALDAIFSLVTLLVMLIYSPRLALVAFVALLVYAVIRWFAYHAFHRANERLLNHDAESQTFFLENLRAIQTIKIACLEAHRTDAWNRLAVRAAESKVATEKMTLAFGTGYGILFGLESAAVLGWGALLAIEGSLTIGMLMAFVAYKNEFSSRAQRLIDKVMNVRMLRLHADRLADIALAQAEESGAPPHAPEGGAVPAITLVNVGFRYDGQAPWVLRGIDLEIGGGKFLALTGTTGCGKTTLAKIIMGLLEPTEGTVLLDGVPLRQYGLGRWRAQVAAVMQDDQLLAGTLLENIAGFDARPQPERAQEAARLACMHQDVLRMPLGYETPCAEMGANFSGGQRQRLFLARALYRRPAVLVMDEATSHLDAATERRVNQAIGALAMTRIAVAHRPDVVAMADLVFDVERGAFQAVAHA